MKIAIVTAVWKRPEIFELFARQCQALQDGSDLDEIQVFVAGSEGSRSEMMVRSKGFNYIETPNSPLGRKMNRALKLAREWSPDYCLLVGSDDLISEAHFNVLVDEMDRGIDFIGSTDFYFYDVQTRSAIYWGGYDKPSNRGFTTGAGRCISRDLLDKMGWMCWDNDIDRKLDTSMQRKLQDHHFSSTRISLRDRGVVSVDVKSSVNKTPFARWDNTEVIDANLIEAEFPSLKEIKRMKITANLATIPGRAGGLKKVVQSLIDQVDLIRIYLNYPMGEGLPDVGPDLEKIIFLDGADLTDNGKFFALDGLEEPEYYFSCDDDIIYPPDYVHTTIKNIEAYGLIVSYHGRKLLAKDVRYYDDHKFYHCLQTVHANKKIDVAGTGVTAFRTDYFHPKGLAHSDRHRMSDLLFSLEAARQGKRIGAFAHEAGWLKAIDYKESIFNTESANGQEVQIELANEIFDLNHASPKQER